MKRFSKILAGILCACSLIGFAGCKDGEEGGGDTDFQVYVPDGAPALSMAMMMSEDTDTDTFDYHVVSANDITLALGRGEGTADFAVVPVNTASQLLRSGTEYKLLGSVTQGNLYLLAQKGSGQVTPDNFVSSLKGKTVGVVQLAKFPGLMMKATVRDYLDYTTGERLQYNELTNGETPLSNCVNLLPINPTQVGLLNDTVDYYMVFEPNASKAVSNVVANLEFVGSLQELYGRGSGYPQAVLMVRTSLVESDSALVKNFMTKMEQADDWVLTADSQVIYNAILSHATEGMSLMYNVENLNFQSIMRSSVSFERAVFCKNKIDELLLDLRSINMNVQLMTDNIYYLG